MTRFEFLLKGSCSLEPKRPTERNCHPKRSEGCNLNGIIQPRFRRRTNLPLNFSHCPFFRLF
jgi:hypothetical protein